MKVLIIEDEHPAAERMVELIHVYDKTINIAGVIDSVKDVILWFQENPQPDLIFMDIQLADGLSFDIFQKTTIDSPVIFTTAYQEYAIKAFKVNSIDYLLKPIDFSELKTAIDKYKKLFREEKKAPVLHDEIINNVRKLIEKPYKNRFIIKIGEHLRPIPTKDIHYFFSLEKTTNLCTSDAKIYIIDYSLDQLTELLDPDQFFRTNRQNIINRDAIADIVVYSKNRLKIKLTTPGHEPIIVSRDKVPALKNWLDG
ncbi:MAG: response regulator transcription factor [Prolixibacteraceae bacterium]|nr:response regulator transcription factor [Prolixibacteraceae bacterium]MBN2773097.1 response regulator transcription factor [Prolixibacteraceae bacterium]